MWNHSSLLQNCYLGKTSCVEQEKWHLLYKKVLSTILGFTKTGAIWQILKRDLSYLICSWPVQSLQMQKILTGDTIAALYVGKTCCFSLSYGKGQGVCGSSARQIIHAPLPSSVIPFHSIGTGVTSELCRGSSDPWEAEPLSHCISIKTSFISHSVTLEAVPPGNHCNSYNGYTVSIIMCILMALG